MSTNKSANLGLHLWEPEDHFLRTEFNENTTRVDTAAGIWPVQVLDVTTQETAREVELDVSHIDFTAYLELNMYIMGPMALGDAGYDICLRCNGLTTGYEWAHTDGSIDRKYDKVYVRVASSMGNPVIRLRFTVGHPDEFAVVAAGYHRACTGEFGFGSTVGAFPVTWGEVKSLQFSFVASSPVFPAGTRFILRGIRR